MEFTNLLSETTDGVVTLTVNSPRTLNALTSAVLRELECALYELNLDPKFRKRIVKQVVRPAVKIIR